ncbi:MAG: pantetheine-phosphate adenylyltransferase [Candidatus Wildermuthbacteria bacterium]|nr:pantetheine-phosphate adenylyltransferase [Candidatus Wildermuthbacteria bacterium]
MASATVRVAGLGGTFDHFHKGHERFILFAAHIAQRLQIGITTQGFIQNKPLAYLCQEYEERARAVEEFCVGHNIPFEIIPLHNAYGPTLEGSVIEALCVTKETELGGVLINKTRKERGLPEFPIYVCDYYLDELGRPLHSVDIRAGKVNREGRVYERILYNTLTLNKRQRDFFTKSQGTVLQRFERSSKEGVFAVGDATLEYFVQHALPYQLGVYDKKRKRIRVDSSVIDALKPDVAVENKAGSISFELTSTLQAALQKRLRHVFVEGEEDLATVALVLLLPLGSLVYYGQPDIGIVEIRVTEKIKDRFYEVLNSDRMDSFA